MQKKFQENKSALYKHYNVSFKLIAEQRKKVTYNKDMHSVLGNYLNGILP